MRRDNDVRFSGLPRRRTTLPGEDSEFVFRLSRDPRVAHSPIVTVEYLVNPESFCTPWTAASTRSAAPRFAPALTFDEAWSYPCHVLGPQHPRCRDW